MNLDSSENNLQNKNVNSLEKLMRGIRNLQN